MVEYCHGTRVDSIIYSVILEVLHPEELIFGEVVDSHQESRMRGWNSQQIVETSTSNITLCYSGSQPRRLQTKNKERSEKTKENYTKTWKLAIRGKKQGKLQLKIKNCRYCRF